MLEACKAMRTATLKSARLTICTKKICFFLPKSSFDIPPESNRYISLLSRYTQLTHCIVSIQISPAIYPSSSALVHGSFAPPCLDSSAVQRALVCEVSNSCTETGSQATHHRAAPAIPDMFQGGQDGNIWQRWDPECIHIVICEPYEAAWQQLPYVLHQ